MDIRSSNQKREHGLRRKNKEHIHCKKLNQVIEEKMMFISTTKKIVIAWNANHKERVGQTNKPNLTSYASNLLQTNRMNGRVNQRGEGNCCVESKEKTVLLRRREIDTGKSVRKRKTNKKRKKREEDGKVRGKGKDISHTLISQISVSAEKVIASMPINPPIR